MLRRGRDLQADHKNDSLHYAHVAYGVSTSAAVRQRCLCCCKYGYDWSDALGAAVVHPRSVPLFVRDRPARAQDAGGRVSVPSKARLARKPENATAVDQAQAPIRYQ